MSNVIRINQKQKQIMNQNQIFRKMSNGIRINQNQREDESKPNKINQNQIKDK
jgi:hypothetical protein